MIKASPPLNKHSTIVALLKSANYDTKTTVTEVSTWGGDVYCNLVWEEKLMELGLQETPRQL